MGVSQNYGYPFGAPRTKDYSILGSILGLAYFGKLPSSTYSGPISIYYIPTYMDPLGLWYALHVALSQRNRTLNLRDCDSVVLRVYFGGAWDTHEP